MTQTDLQKQFNLNDKIAVITGAAGELCGNMAIALGRLGVKVALLDIDDAKAEDRSEAIKKEGGKAITIHCNVLDENNLKEAAVRIGEYWGVPDILINGAGGNHPSGSVDKEFAEAEDLNQVDIKTLFSMPLEGFSRVMNLNFIGTFLPVRVFSQGMVREGRGVILNMSSMSALTALTKVPAYSAAKAAVSNFTSWLAVHFASTGIRVNALAPGFLMTEQLRFLHIDQKTGEYTARAKKVLAHTPMGRYGEPDELLGTMIWLLSDASRFVTGIVVPIDGGFSSYSI